MRPVALSKPVLALCALLVFIAGILVCLIFQSHSRISWNNNLDWGAISNLLGAVLNCVTVLIVGWAVADRLQKRQTKHIFERELIAEFTKAALRSTERIHQYLLQCREQSSYTEQDRQQFILLFTALGQDIQLIADTLAATDTQTPSTDNAQSCRSKYKDLLTDQAPGTCFTPEDERTAYVHYREMRNHLVQLVFDVNRK